MKIYRQKDIPKLLDAARKRHGTMRVFAAKAKLSESFVSLVKAGHREPGAKLIRALGLDTVYIKRKRS